MSKIKKQPKVKAKATENLTPGKVIMIFSENKFYNDLENPIFFANTSYELEGADWIQRWLKRGGKIVEGELPLPEHEVDPSTLVGDKSEVATVVETVEDADNAEDAVNEEVKTESSDAE